MDSKVCNTCGHSLNSKNKVKNRCVCKTCFKSQKSDYDHARKHLRRREVKTYKHNCKFCLHEFVSKVHNKSYCSDICKKRYKNAVRRVKRRQEIKKKL